MKLTALWAVAILSLWIRTSANFSASTVLSLIATPWSALFLRVSCKIKWLKIKNVKHSHPSTTGFAASSPGFPRSPGRWNPNFLKETLLKTILAALAALYLPWGLYWFMVMDSKPSRPNQTIPDLWTYLTYLSDLPTYLPDLPYLPDIPIIIFRIRTYNPCDPNK